MVLVIRLLCPIPGDSGPAPDQRQVRDPVFHRVGHPGPVPEDHREVGLPGAALGALHHSERRLPAADVVTRKKNADQQSGSSDK